MTPYPFFGILLIMEGELFPKQKGCDPEIASLLFRPCFIPGKIPVKFRNGSKRVLRASFRFHP